MTISRRERRRRLGRAIVVASAATLLACAAARGRRPDSPGELWAFTAPWDTQLTYNRQPNLRFKEDVCAEKLWNPPSSSAKGAGG